MPAYRYPVLVSEDHDHGFTAALVDEPDSASFGTSFSDALDQLKEFLEWQQQQEPWRTAPDFLEPRLTHVKVEVRPEYQVTVESRGRERTRTYPCQEPITLRIACVHGRDSSGLLVCTLPMLGQRFTYYDRDSLKNLVTHYVQSALKGLTPRQLSGFLPPKSSVLEEIVIQVPQKEREACEEVELPMLSAIAEPLGVRGMRRQLSRPWERDDEVVRLVTMLLREKNSVILLGESGAGKTAVLAEAVRKVERDQPIAKEAATEEAATIPVRHRFWMTNGARLIAGMRYLGQWQERCESVIEELSQIKGVLCIENLLDLVRSGGIGPGDSIAAFLVPYIQRGELRIVAEATPAELDACRRLLPGLADLFQVLTIPKFTRQQAVAALQQVAAGHERNLGQKAENGVIELVYRLFTRFMPYQGFPGRATAFVNDLFDRAYRAKAKIVSLQAVVAELVRQTGLPELFLRDELPLVRDDVLAQLRRQVIGQEAPCEAAADVIMTFKAGLNDPHRPLAVMLFCGPTGVGKTELAKAISQFFFGHGEQKDRMIRLDMSEYAGPGAARRFLGSERGEPSDLIRRVRQQPFGVLLLDEIEKAAPEIFDLLLGIFDEGRLTDPYGRLTTFRSMVIIMTSNLGADRPEAFGFGKSAGPQYDADAMGFFRPEFYNRFDAIVSFEPLALETMLRITEKELREIAGREGLTRLNLRLKWGDDVVSRLAENGFDRRYGARPLQRTLEQRIVAPLARYLVEHPGLRDGQIVIVTDPRGVIGFKSAGT
jgi:ATP-dependent Clp protease ATP-binding subunit ClpC